MRQTVLSFVLIVIFATVTPVAGREKSVFLTVPRTLSNPDATLHENSWLPEAFVGVALSGGGSRAANFSAAVLRYLEELGILEKVTAMSSVSGSSITTAYYALHGEELVTDPAWGKLQEKLRQDYTKSEILLVLGSLLGFNKTKIIESRFNDSFFQDATFADLGAPGPRRPLLLINSTMFGTGQGFVFDSDLFNKSMLKDNVKFKSSQLAMLPVVQAVAASAAFPGLLDSVDFPADEGEIPTYRHLYDGGVTDNLGVEHLLLAAQNYYAEIVRRNRPFRGCAIIVVDGGREASEVVANRMSNKEPDLRSGIVSKVINRDANDAINLLVDNYSKRNLREVGVEPMPDHPRPGANTLFSKAWVLNTPDGNTEQPLLSSVGTFRLFAQEQDLSFLKKVAPQANSEIKCTTWYIAPRRLTILDLVPQKPASSLKDKDSSQYNEMAYRTNEKYVSSNTYDFRWRLRRFFSEIVTDFSLTGPDYCEPEFIQERIFDAARILTLEDQESLKKFCDVLSQISPAGTDRCKPAIDRLNRPDLYWRIENDQREFDREKRIKADPAKVICPLPDYKPLYEQIP